MGYFRKKKNKGRGWGQGISRGIEKTKYENSRGQEKEFAGVIKKRSCAISTSLRYKLWNFLGM